MNKKAIPARYQKKIAELEAACLDIIKNKQLKNARLYFARIKKAYNKYSRDDKAIKAAKVYISFMSELIEATNAPQIDAISFYVEWKKSRMYGWCPRVQTAIYAGENVFRSSGYASGYGYDKLSSALNTALHGPVWLRFFIENMQKFKKQKTYGAYFNLHVPFLDFGGCGLSTFTHILKDAGWKFDEHKAYTYDNDGSILRGYVSK